MAGNTNWNALAAQLRAASSALASPEALLALIKESASMSVVAAGANGGPGSSDIETLLKRTVRTLGETDSNPGRAYALARATVLASQNIETLGGPTPDSVADSVAVLASLDPDLPELVANTPGALEALVAATGTLKGGLSNAQQEWLPHLHRAFVLLRIVGVDTKEEATRKMLQRAHDAKLERGDDIGQRLLSRLADRDY